MKSLWILGAGLLFSGCMASNALTYESEATTNQYHLAKVRKGMTQKEVLWIMHKPYSYESFEKDDDIYDVWFYVTWPTGLDQTRMVSQNLTPLTFKNGILVGTGYNWYYYAMKQETTDLAPQSPEEEAMKKKASENKAFEDALRSPGKPEKKPSQPPPKEGKAEKKATSQKEKLPPNVRIVSDSDETSSSNRFDNLTKGMSQTQIYRAFGEPFALETFELNGSIYDIWSYETHPPKTKSRVNPPQKLTFLTFKNAHLISTNGDEFYELKKRAEGKTALTEAKWAPPRFVKPYLGAKTISPKQFSYLRKKMTEAEVLEKIGPPIEREQYSSGEDLYDVWFYEVNFKRKETKKIPVTFKNNLLYGTTFESYNEVKTSCSPQKANEMINEESDQNFNYW